MTFLYLWFTLMVGNFYPILDGYKKVWTVIRPGRGAREPVSTPTDSDDSNHETKLASDN